MHAENHIDRPVKCQLHLSDFNQKWMCWQIFVQICAIKFHENLRVCWWK